MCKIFRKYVQMSSVFFVIVFLSEVISVTGRFLLISLGTGVIMVLGTYFK